VAGTLALSQDAADKAASSASRASLRTTRPARNVADDIVSPQTAADASNRVVRALQAAVAATPQGMRFMPLQVVNLSGNKLSNQLVAGWSLFEQLQVSAKHLRVAATGS
jgi:hypothetical protein